MIGGTLATIVYELGKRLGLLDLPLFYGCICTTVCLVAAYVGAKLQLDYSMKLA